MSVRDDATGLEYAGAGPARTVPRWPQRRPPGVPSDAHRVPRFHRQAQDLLARPGDDLTLRDFLTRHRFTPFFSGASWNRWSPRCGRATPQSRLDYPARYLFTFLQHHGMLSITGSPVWRP